MRGWWWCINVNSVESKSSCRMEIKRRVVEEGIQLVFLHSVTQLLLNHWMSCKIENCIQALIRLQSAGTCAQPSSAPALWTLAPSLGAKAPCRPCRGWRRGWGWGHPPLSYKRWPQWPTQTGPSSAHAPWSDCTAASTLTMVTSDLRGGSEVCSRGHVGRFNSTDSPWKERKWITWFYLRYTYIPHVHTHLATVNLPVTWACWVHRWGQLSKDYFLSDKLVTRSRWLYPSRCYIWNNLRMSRMYMRAFFLKCCCNV